MKAWISAALLVTSVVRAAPSPEVQLCETSLRDGELVRAEKALGPLEELPLYRGELVVDPEDRVVHGRLLIRYPIRGKAPAFLELRLTPNAFHPEAVALEDMKLEGREVKPEVLDPDRLRVPLAGMDPKATSISLDVAFSARVPKAPPAAMSPLGGLSLSGKKTDHGAFTASADFVSLVGVLPQVPPQIGARTLPRPSGIGDFALYEPGNYLISVRVPPGFRVHATGNALGEVPEKDGDVRFSFGAAAVRDFPILVSRDDTTQTAKVGDLTVESTFSPRDARGGKKVLTFARQALAQFEKRFGPTPQATFRLVEAPLSGGAGGMEFPGLVTIGAALYHGGADLFGLGALSNMPQLAGASAFFQSPDMDGMVDQLLEFTVAHEVAHQYFAGLVGSDPVHDPIVDESLAQAAALLYMGWEHGPKAAHAIKESQLVLPYELYRLTGGEDGRAERPTSDFPNEFEYAAMVYAKGPLLHEAERKLLGEDAFVSGVRAYVDAYRYKWACADCFTRTLAERNPSKAAELRGLRARWWREAHGDQDVGKANVGQMVKQMTGADLDPQSEQLINQLLPQLLQQMQGAQGP